MSNRVFLLTAIVVCGLLSAAEREACAEPSKTSKSNGAVVVRDLEVPPRKDEVGERTTDIDSVHWNSWKSRLEVAIEKRSSDPDVPEQFRPKKSSSMTFSVSKNKGISMIELSPKNNNGGGGGGGEAPPGDRPAPAPSFNDTTQH